MFTETVCNFELSSFEIKKVNIKKLILKLASSWKINHMSLKSIELSHLGYRVKGHCLYILSRRIFSKNNYYQCRFKKYIWLKLNTHYDFFAQMFGFSGFEVIF